MACLVHNIWQGKISYVFITWAIKNISFEKIYLCCGNVFIHSVETLVSQTVLFLR